MRGKSRTLTKVPVSERALLQRINRRLVQDNGKVKAGRGDLGAFYRIDTRLNGVVETDVDLEAFGRKLGVLAAWEALVR